jgi:hypothetical protein
MQQSCEAFHWTRLIWEAFVSATETATLWGMDSVRFGRALGIGARLAAKTLATAVDAATAPNPSAGNQQQGAAKAASATTPHSGKAEAPARVVQQAARTTAQVRQTGQALKQGGKGFSEAFGGRLARLSGALWLELTGVFFGIFALFAASGAWKMRAALRDTAATHDAHVRLLFAVAMAALFGYFCISSFVRANRRSRGR